MPPPPSSTPARIICPHCAAGVKTPALAPGSIVNCPRCGKAFPLASPGAAAPVAPAAKGEIKAHVSETASAQEQSVPQPPAKPKAPPPVEIAVICKVCGTRMHALEAQIGRKIRCPDCTTEALVKAPVVVASSAKKPSLDDAVEYELDDPGERPKYRPMVDPRGEDEILDQLSVMDTRSTTIEGSLPQPIGNVTSATTAHTSAATAPSEEDGEFKLSEAVERPVYKPEMPPVPAAEEFAARQREERTRYEDEELWNRKVDRNDPNAWQKSPFLVGIFDFLVHVDAIAPWVFHCLGAAALLMLGQFVVALSQGGKQQVVAFPFSALLSILSLAYYASLSACCLAIAQDTANGMKHVSSWPGWDMEWISTVVIVPIAGGLAALPGMLAAWVLIQGADLPILVAPLLMLASGLMIFPFVLFSMLAEGTILSPYSAVVVKSLNRAGDGWLLFYMESLVLGMAATIGIVIAAIPHWVSAPIGGILLVTLAFIYFRLVGRLMWYCQKQLPVVDAGDASE